MGCPGVSGDITRAAWRTASRPRAPTAVGSRRVQRSGGITGRVPEITSCNGRRLALGDDLEPIVLFEEAKPGDKVLVAVKLLPTVDEKRIAGVDLSLEFATNRPNPADLLTEFETAALLIPSLSK